MRITTKTGDKGMTSLYDGQRVSKADPRIELLGELDELNARVGFCKALTESKKTYETIQEQLMRVMTIVATPGKNVSEKDSEYLDQSIAMMEERIKEKSSTGNFTFTLPGQSMEDAALHLARTATRTCERKWISMKQTTPSPSSIGIYLNRLSDYFYALTLPDSE